MLILDKQGTEVKREGLRLKIKIPVEEEKDEVIHVPVIKIQRVFVYGYVQITTQALTLLLSEGIPVYFFSLKGKLKGILDTYPSINAPVRIIQYRKSISPSFCLNISKKFIYGKLHNSKRLLQRISYNRPGFDVKDSVNEIRYLISFLDTARTIQRIRGIEGKGTAIYFKEFSKALGLKHFQRTRHPPRDPQNAFLSYGYTVLTGEVISNLNAFGLDPYIGFYHTLRYGRPGLALDLMEEFRHPVIDMTILELWSHRIIKEDDFEMTDYGWRLKRDAKKKFFELYDRRMQNFRPAIRKQCQLLVNAILEKEEYKPFLVG